MPWLASVNDWVSDCPICEMVGEEMGSGLGTSGLLVMSCVMPLMVLMPSNFEKDASMGIPIAIQRSRATECTDGGRINMVL